MASTNYPERQTHGRVQKDITSQLEQLTINVTPVDNIIGANDPNIYKNSSIPHGLVFIANYKEFKNNRPKTRHGSEKDAENLKELFEMTGYIVPDLHVNMKTNETEEAIKKFQNNQDLKKVDSCFVIIMSHGKDAKKFHTWDSTMDIIKDVVEKFTDEECPNLKGIPKIFIFQYCRGGLQDKLKKPDHHTTQPYKDEGTEMDGPNIGTGTANVAAYANMLIIYSTVEGYVSYRDEDQGSWLMHAICNIFMKNAHEKHIVELMNMVTQKMLNEYSTSRLQVCQIVNPAGFHRQLYLNPDPGMLLREKFENLCNSSSDEAFAVLCELTKKSKLYTVQDGSYARIEFGKENVPKSSFWSLFRRGTDHVTQLIMKARESRELSPISTLRFEDLLKVVEPQYPEVYLDLSYNGKELGRLQIQLNGVSYPRRVKLFMDLCISPTVPTWQNTSFHSLHNKGVAGETVSCLWYISTPTKIGSETYTSTEKFVPVGTGALEAATTPPAPRGIIQGELRGYPDKDKVGFLIVTQSDPTATGNDDWPVLGQVVDGLDLLHKATSTCPGGRWPGRSYTYDFTSVTITNSGATTSETPIVSALFLPQDFPVTPGTSKELTESAIIPPKPKVPTYFYDMDRAGKYRNPSEIKSDPNEKKYNFF